ncbi:MAG: carboxypeptidase-like regulatory domain-containing protein, partial [Saprospiraceae bacterium]|nr:carboxypeptidase-like regulatory domain-containing protein [Saprospiraceae bacterium]
MKKLCLFFSFLLAPMLAFAQLSGKVLDENGDPLPFASVYVRNSTNGTAANADGEYRLSLSRGAYEVVFQYIGYKQKIEPVTIGDRPLHLDVRLEPTALEISEVVI